MDLLARTAHREHVEALADAGVLEGRGRRAALNWIRARLDWAGWLDRLLLAVGAALVLSGVIYFSAYNWFSIPPWVKFVTLQAAVAGTAVAAWRVGLERAAGKMLLMGSSVLVGVLLAVFGQVYQTGADTWELFAGWAALIAGWVAIGRFAPLWVLFIVLIDLGISLYAGTLSTWRTLEWTSLALATVNGAALAAWEIGAARGVEWLDVRWPRRLLWLTALAPLTVLAVEMVWKVEHGAVIAGVLGWLIAMAAGLRWYRFGAVVDITSLSMGAASAGAVALAIVSRMVPRSLFGGEGFFTLAVAAIVIAGTLGTWLKSVSDSKEVLE
jgi:uncharacterized membrane protein